MLYLLVDRNFQIIHPVFFQLDLFKGCTSIVTMDYAFANCNKLTDLPQKLFESCKNTLNKNVTGLFKDCSRLTGTAIKFWNGYHVTSSLE